MTKQMQEPQIKEINKTENTVNLILTFKKEAEYFNGHFPGMPILPGVAQIHYAITYAARYFEIEPKINKMTKLRFTNIIQPDVQLTLTLEKQDNKITFKYANEKKGYSSGIIHLKGQEPA